MSFSNLSFLFLAFAVSFGNLPFHLPIQLAFCDSYWPVVLCHFNWYIVTANSLYPFQYIFSHSDWLCHINRSFTKLQVGSGNGTAMTMNMTLDLTTIACNVVLGYRRPFDLISVHDVDDNHKMVGVAHLVAGEPFYPFDCKWDILPVWSQSLRSYVSHF